jgi:RNA polymerase sigma-70 factor (ECF subfamily)
MWDVQELFRLYRTDVDRFLRRRVSSPDVAADLVQDLFLKLLSACPSAAIENRKGYLLQAAKNLAINHNKRERLIAYEDPTHLEFVVDEAPDAERVLLSRQELRIVAEVLAGVPPIQREIFILARVDGNTFPSIGKKLGMSEKTVYSHMVRVLLRIQLRFENL